MPDSAKKPEDQELSESGTKIKIAVPHAASTKKKEHTQVEVRPGLGQEDVMVSEVVDPTGEHEPLPERRKPQGTQVLVQHPPVSAGLSGPWATVANMSAIGAFILLMFLMYRDFVTTVRERDALIREEMGNNRTSEQATNAAMVAALAGLGNKMDALVISNNTAAAEFRQARQEIVNAVKMFGKPPGPEEEQGRAPMPRVKGDGEESR